MNISFKLKSIALLGVFVFLFSACQNETEELPFRGSIEFQFSSAKSIAGKTAKDGLADARFVLVTIATPDGETIYEKEKLTLYAFGDSFVSEPLSLTVSLR